MRPRLDPSLTFDTFVIGAGNRLAASAARRSAEAPGTYNPLVVYGPAGTGKTHLLHALGQKALEIRPDLNVVYETLESFVDRLSAAIAAGRLEQFRKQYLRVDLLLLDDAQFLTGKVRTQEELLPIWDVMGRNGAQVVLASDRPPTDIDGLDVRLGARFARGLIVDVLSPELETRIAILERKLAQRDARLHEGVAASLARVVTGGGHALEQALERVLEVQQQRGAALTVGELGPLLGFQPEAAAPAAAEPDPFDAFIYDITVTLAEVVDAAPWRKVVAEAILRWEGEGLRTRRLETALEVDSAPDVEQLLAGFEADAARLREIGQELAELEPRLASSPALRDPDRVAEAEALLLATQLERRALPHPPIGATLATFGGREALESPAVAAARRVAARPGGEHNPLVVYGPAERTAHYLAAVGNAALAGRRTARVAFLRGADLVAEHGRAAAAGYLELWRRRYEAAEFLLLDDLEAFAGNDAAQASLLELLDVLLRHRAQLVLGARAAPRELAGLDPRLRSRFEGGTVLDLVAAGIRRAPLEGVPAAPAFAASAAERRNGLPDRWFFSREKFAVNWTALEDRLIEELG